LNVAYQHYHADFLIRVLRFKIERIGWSLAATLS
jgi:hypothetical protein